MSAAKIDDGKPATWLDHHPPELRYKIDFRLSSDPEGSLCSNDLNLTNGTWG
jgi:hypothetical protein